MYPCVHSTACFLIIVTGHSCSPYVAWGDGSGDGHQTDKFGPVTMTHTYKRPGCKDVLLMYGQWNPYCGAYTRHVVDSSHYPIEDADGY